MNARVKHTRPRTIPGTSLLKGLVLTCCVIEAILFLADRNIVFPRDLRGVVYDYAAFWPGLLRDWKPHYPLQPQLMFITYGFLHGGIAHLAFNMLTLWSLGRIVLLHVGTKGFLTIYTAALIVGAAFFGSLSESGSPMVGASGALFGLAGAILLWVWRAQPTFADSLRATWKIYAFLILYNVVMYFALSGGLAWETHLGGFIAGWLVAWVYSGKRR